MDPKKSKLELTGLLGFYSDRATTHASFTVAVVFGMFALLTIDKGASLANSRPIHLLYNTLFYVAYFGLTLAVIYLVLNFGWYAQIAEKTKYLLLGEQYTTKGFRRYSRITKNRNLDDFLNDSAKLEWLYETAERDIYDPDEIRGDLKKKIEGEKKRRVFRCFHRRFVKWKYGISKEDAFCRVFGADKLTHGDIKWDRNAIKESLRDVKLDIPMAGNYHRMFIFCLGSLLLLSIVLFMKIANDWVGVSCFGICVWQYLVGVGAAMALAASLIWLPLWFVDRLRKKEL